MIELEQRPERALLVGLDTGEEDTEALLEELEELATTAGAEVIAKVTQKLPCPEKATFIGSGKLEEITEFCESNEIDLLIFDTELSPTQQRNIEQASGVRTIDRTLLILDIFAGRATSGEGRIQVELARYRYLLPRLSGQGQNLSRQGGIGMRRGAGESKLETDKRHIRRRIHALGEQLKEIEVRRENQRKRRRKNGIPTVAIVGYTNAGKSTLMNYLTEAGVLVEDMLFATLDPTARGLKLPDGRNVMLVDTVGLIRKLPHHLVEAFHSTLEEAAEANVILNVCDLSNPEAEEHLRVTNDLLTQLGCGEIPVLPVFNKIDMVDDPLLIPKQSIGISALNGQGIDRLLEEIADALPPTRVRVEMLLPFHRGEIAPLLRKNGVIHAEEYVAEGLKLDCTIDKLDAEKYQEFITNLIE
ncbi:MAG: GTPase HflX [Clostridia bacterium]|nr:GTPase HflX [Clostridia bacterium]